MAGLPFANRLEPVVLGLPFLLFWILGWVLLTPVFLGVAYLLAARGGRPRGGRRRTVTTPLLVIVAFVLVSAAVGVIGRGRGEMNIERWSVGGRRFGVVLVWLLTAGEIYTTFTFLGASGWAYSRGAPAFYILAYGTIGYIVSFFLLPPVWRMAKRLGLHTQPDFFLARYDSPGARRRWSC